MTAASLDIDDSPADLPFPLESFPPAVAKWLEDTAIQARVPVAFVAFPFLALTGAVLGNQVALQVGSGWTEWPALWVALVAPTGHGKTPAIAAARAPFKPLHGTGSSLDALFDSMLDELDAEREARRLAAAESPATPEPPDGTVSPVEGEPLPGDDIDPDHGIDFDRLLEASPLFITTTRIDYLTRALARATGLCLLRDELASLIHTLDRGRSEDRLTLLSLWSSEPFYPHDPDLAPALDPVLGIVGGFQPGLLQHLQARSQDGLLERFLLVYPGSPAIPRPDFDQPAPDPAPIMHLITPLRPIERTVVTLSPEASLAWRGWFHCNITEAQTAGPTLDGFYRKLPTHVARIGLILHALWEAEHLDQPLPDTTIRHAIALAEFLRPHTRRVATELGERGRRQSAVESLAQRALAVLAIESGWLARTQLQQRLGRPDTARFNRAIAWLTEREAIEVSRETIPGSKKPVVFYCQASQPASPAHGDWSGRV